MAFGETAAQAVFLSYHLMSVMTHTGNGSYGQAHGIPVRSRINAECWVQHHVAVDGEKIRLGHADLDHFMVAYLALFPDTVLRIHSTRVNRDPSKPRAHRAALVTARHAYWLWAFWRTDLHLGSEPRTHDPGPRHE
jgi:hypothetical protein